MCSFAGSFSFVLSDGKDGSSWALLSAGMEVSGMESSRLAKASTVYSSMATHPINSHNQCESTGISFSELVMSTATSLTECSQPRVRLSCAWRRGCGEPRMVELAQHYVKRQSATIYGLNLSFPENPRIDRCTRK